MGAMIVLVGGLVALAMGFFWIALSARWERRLAAGRVERVIMPHLLAPTLELQAPFTQRVLRPLLRQFLRRLGALSPGRNLESLRRQLLVAGSPMGLGPLDFIGLRFVITLLGTMALALLVLRSSLPDLRRIIVLLAGALVAAEVPRYWLRRRMRLRRKQITLALPNALDMLTVCVDAGMALEAALLRISQLWDNALAQEFGRVVTEMGVGNRLLLDSTGTPSTRTSGVCRSGTIWTSMRRCSRRHMMPRTLPRR